MAHILFNNARLLDPIRKLELLTRQDERLSIIMKAGRFHRNRFA